MATERHSELDAANVASSLERIDDLAPLWRVATFEFDGVPAGKYDIRAILIGPDGRMRAEADASATVIPRDGDQ